MDLILSQLASLISGLCASMGVGGGTILILYLTLIRKSDQLYSQGINLIFFIPIALTAVLRSIRSGLYKFSDVFIMAIFGGVSCILGLLLAFFLKSQIVGTFFGVFLLISGAREAVSIIKGIKKGKK
jgi:uncharacterized membrane protein YfcA